MEFVVCSDNHGNAKVLSQILRDHPKAQAFIHCGDSEMSNEAMAPFVAVTGNNDYYYKFPETLVTQVGDIRILILHGHTMPYGSRVKSMVALAKEKNCSVVCTGHTHVFMNEVIDGVRVINPGSLFYNRDGSAPCYCSVEFEGDTITNVKRIEI